MPFALRLMEFDGADWAEVARLDGVTTAPPVWTAPVTEVLNSIGSAGFSLSLDDPGHAAMVAALAEGWLSREVWVYDVDLPARPFLRPDEAPADPLTGLVPLWQGVPIRPSKAIGARLLTVQCAEVLWYLTRRYFGRTDRHNYVDPGASFENGLEGTPGWAFGGPGAGTNGIDDDRAKLGSYSAWQTGANDDDRFLENNFNFTSGGIGNVLAVAAWYYIEPGATGTSFNQRLLYAETQIAGIVQDVRYTRLDAAKFVTGTWIRAEIPLDTTIRVPPSTNLTVNVRLYGINGTIRWDAALCVVMESFSSAQPGGSDLATLAGGMVNHAQDAAFDKDEIDFDLDTPATGRLLARAWQFEDHANIWSVGLQDLMGREDGIDVSMSYEADGRTFHTHSRVAPALGRGADLTGLDLSLTGGNVIGYGYTRDGQQAANSITILGDGDGPDREEGGFLDLSAYGGRALELILQAPQDSDIDGLDQRAARTGAARAQATIVQLLLADGVEMAPGDRITIPAYDPLIEPGVYRVMDVSRNPSNGARTIGANPFVPDVEEEPDAPPEGGGEEGEPDEVLLAGMTFGGTTVVGDDPFEISGLTSFDPDGDPEDLDYDFTLDAAPGGSSATLVPGADPWLVSLTRDVDGDYTVTVTVTNAALETATVTQTYTLLDVEDEEPAGLYATHIPYRVLIGFAAPESGAPQWSAARTIIQTAATAELGSAGVGAYLRRRFSSTQSTSQATIINNMRSLCDDGDAAGVINWVSFKVPPANWAGVAAGSFPGVPAAIRALAEERADEEKAPFICALHHEPRGDGDLATWAAMQRYMSDELADIWELVAWSCIGNGFLWNNATGSSTVQAERAAMFPQSLIDTFRDNHHLVAVDTYDDHPTYTGQTSYPVGGQSNRCSVKLANWIAWMRARNCGALGIGEWSVTDVGEMPEVWEVIRDNRDILGVANYYNSIAGGSTWDWRLIPDSYAPNGSNPGVDYGGTPLTEGRLNYFPTILVESATVYTDPP